MSSKNRSVQHWDDNRNTIRSKKGGWKVGEAIYSHGYSLMDDLVGKASYFQVMMMNVLGYLPERKIADWTEAVFTCMSWPDPRIWCNQIGALGGTSQTKVVGATTAGILAADSTMYGSRPLLDGVEFIQSALNKKKSGLSAQQILDEEIKKHRGKVNIVGYARPIANGDERVTAMERVTDELGIVRGEHLTLALEFNKLLLVSHNESININGYVSAFMSDQGYNATEIYQLYSMCVMSGVTACFIEESRKAPNSFLPWRCDDIEYQGKTHRVVAEKLK